MVDIHSHILPGLDDGSQSFENSVAMLEMAAAAGTTDIVATPHSNQQYKFLPEKNSEHIAELQKVMGDRIRIHTGCDFHLDFENVEDAVAHPAKYTINHHNYLLVELAEFVYGKMVETIIDRLLYQGLTPIITHPERNPMLMRRPDDLVAWVDKGCLVQVTGGSFLGTFGRTAKASAENLLKKGLVHFIASDAHDLVHRTTRLDEAFQLIRDMKGPEHAETLFRTNPAATLTGGLIEVEIPERSSRGRAKWYQFWR